MKNIILNASNINEYIDQIAVIHKNAYHKNHFTSNFSSDKLEEYYIYLLNNSDLSIAYIDQENNHCLGFIIAGKSVSKGIAQFISKNQVYLFKIMLKHPSFLLEKVYTKLYTKIKSSKPTKAKFRLLSISVDKSIHSKGIGKSMLDYFEKELLKLDIHCYGLSVRNTNTRAIKFYKKNHFIEEKQYMGSIYYYKEI